MQVLVDGWAAGVLDRNGVRNLLLPPPAANRTSPSFVPSSGASDDVATLDVVVGAVGRSNQGFLFDTKGLTAPDVFLDGALASPCGRIWQQYCSVLNVVEVLRVTGHKGLAQSKVKFQLVLKVFTNSACQR